MIKELEVITKAIEDKKGTDIVVLDLKGMSGIADYFVLANGSSEPNLKAIIDEIEDRMAEAGYVRVGIEGYREAKWILLDYGDIIIHVFNKESREFYNLEQLWNHAEVVYRL